MTSGAAPTLASAVSVPASAVETGVVAVGAPADDRGAQIVVDGVTKGVAPKQIALPLGEHGVILKRSDGRTLGPILVTVRRDHTARVPLRVTAPP